MAIDRTVDCRGFVTAIIVLSPADSLTQVKVAAHLDVIFIRVGSAVFAGTLPGNAGRMDSQLIRHERQLAFLILCATAIAGLAMAVAGRDGPLGTHGIIVLLVSIAAVFAIMSGYDAPEPAAEPPQRLLRRAEPGGNSPRHGLGGLWSEHRQLGRVAAGISRNDLRCWLGQLGTFAPGAYHIGHFWL